MTREVTSVYLQPHVKDELEQRAAKFGISRSALINMYITHGLSCPLLMNRGPGHDDPEVTGE